VLDGWVDDLGCREVGVPSLSFFIFWLFGMLAHVWFRLACFLFGICGVAYYLRSISYLVIVLEIYTHILHD
jgi:hypothetical protein